MKCVQLVLHLLLVLFHQSQTNPLEGNKCQAYMQEGRVECVSASSDELRNAFNSIVGGEDGIRDLSIRDSDVSALPEFANVEKLQLDNIRLNQGTSLPQLLSKFPRLQLLLLDNSKEKITLTRDTFMPGQPILTLTFANNGLTDADIESDAFENIKNTLKALTMRENQLTYLPTAVTGLTDLRDLDFSGNPIKYFSEETTKQLRSLPKLEAMNVNDLDCQCHLLWESFPTFVREKKIAGVKCSDLSKFPGKSVSQIDMDKACEKSNPGPGPDGSSQMTVSVLALLATILSLFLT